MTTKHCSILTNRGKALEAASAAGGAPVVLDGFVVGDGNGNAVTPEAGQTALVREVYRGTISRLAVSPDQENQFIAYLALPEGVGGFTVREAGLLTTDGELYAVGSCAAIEKPVNGVTATLQFRLAVAESAQVTLNVATGDGLFLRQDRNLSDVEDKDEAVENLGLKPTVDKAKNAVQRSGDKMSGELKIGTVNALRIFDAAFGLIFRRSEDFLHLIPTAEGQGENGDIGPLRPFAINLRTGAVSVSHGAKIDGGLALGTNNTLGGNSIAIGDNDTGLKYNSDGVLDVYANNQAVFRFLNNENYSLKSLKVIGNSAATGKLQAGNAELATDGNVYGSAWGGWLSAYLQNKVGVQDVRLGGYQQMGSTGSNLAPSGYVSVGGYCYGDWDNSADGWFIRPLQKLINGTWYNVASM
ncbi:phage tail protein [Escherichia coli]|uniref:phage tail protein n=2 Tax=Escherichia coli TaxID=562 RepID=UPI00136C1462|nr:phage tail protein [Escherichia coli]